MPGIVEFAVALSTEIVGFVVAFSVSVQLQTSTCLALVGPEMHATESAIASHAQQWISVFFLGSFQTDR